jgi:hypothetical protein
MPLGGALLAAYTGYGWPAAIVGGMAGMVIAVLDFKYASNAPSR